MAKVSIIMSCFNRSDLLKWGLASIHKQEHRHELEVVVVNDGPMDETENVCNSFKGDLNIKYVFVGQRNVGGLIPRNPCFANNIAFKQSSGEIILLTCPEIYQIGTNVISRIVEPLLVNKKILSIPKSFFEDTGYVVQLLSEGYSIEETFRTHKKLRTVGTKKLVKYGTNRTVLPFLMGLWRNCFEEIGGYDEDFTGIAGEDNDFIDRLQLSGFNYHVTEAEIIHLYHPKVFVKTNNRKQYKYNVRLRRKKKHTIVRNEGREWGKL